MRGYYSYIELIGFANVFYWPIAVVDCRIIKSTSPSSA